MAKNSKKKDTELSEENSQLTVYSQLEVANCDFKSRRESCALEVANCDFKLGRHKKIA